MVCICVEETVDVKDLTIDILKDHLKRHSYLCLKNPGGELFQNINGFLLDVQSINVMCLVYDNLNEKNKLTFNNIIQNEYKLAGFLDRMWSWVK